MNSITLGPFSLSAILFICLIAAVASLGTAAVLDRKTAGNVEPILWKSLLAGLLVGRLVFVFNYFDLYKQSFISMIDVRDGGFAVWAAIFAAIFTAAWYTWRKPSARKPLVLCTMAGLGALGMAYAALNLFSAPAPSIRDLTLSGLDDQPVLISEFQGKPAVINLWASWCPPCRREMPALQAGQTANPDIHFVFANQGESASIIKNYLNEENLSLDNILLDSRGELAKEVKSRGLPTTLFLDAQGRLVDIRVGELSSATLEDRVKSLRSGSAALRIAKD